VSICSDLVSVTTPFIKFLYNSGQKSFAELSVMLEFHDNWCSERDILVAFLDQCR
jgi:hypothetical protein